MSAVIAGMFGVHAYTLAAEPFEVSAWIPYWRSVEGSVNIGTRLGSFTEVNPFVYSVRSDGTLKTNSSLSNSEWGILRENAKRLGVRFVPTIMWSDADAIDAILSNPRLRAAHVQAIAREVYAYALDGIDIDYEGKYARTAPYFSQFLKQLYESIGYDKWVMCTIESRTPLDSRYSSSEKIPKDITYSNDFKAIGIYCDRVRIMAYDQMRIDIKLNASNTDPYIPIADTKWVEKVMRLAAEEISPSKLVIGIPTYGYEYDMFPASWDSTKFEYSKLWSFNPTYATNLSASLGRSIVRNSAGELSLVFPASESPEAKPLPNATRVLTWSDGEAIRKKVELAKALGLRGVAIFKIDSGQDAAIWDIAAANKGIGRSMKIPDVALGRATSTPTVENEIPVPERNLGPGSTGEDVRNLQKLLNKLGFTIVATGVGSPGNESAYFGAATYRALIRFQQAKKITPAIGRYGPKTRSLLFLEFR
ncbi:MAG: DNA topoisomerase IV subunit A [Parcubacteria group bacterium Gr01-1014_48]|nr:MAG: DNA topoisomerase IV subunit A [Parcubacteria group bacterium Greene0416_14]TSC74367.1 MAG: DNA topoisomerase IV subunit A [Parcubacteria group bacterium Gr01-1014_48]TSD00716.1 MAG: DNA topoisomerase IV subunit A [Parcubacteria group bacterium Greene1014_15]